MQPTIPTTSGGYSFLYFCQFTGSDEKLVDVASFISSNNTPDNIFAFDRLLWSGLSSGQMPSQLYTFNFYNSDKGCEVEEGVMLIFSKEEISEFPAYLSLKHEMNLEKDSSVIGEMAEAFEEDEEFLNCLYASCLIWQSFNGEFPEVDQVKNVWLQSGSSYIQLLSGTSLFSQDDWVENYFNSDSSIDSNKLLSAVHLLIPCRDKLQELEESVRDKERIHLDPEIKGIYC